MGEGNENFVGNEVSEFTERTQNPNKHFIPGDILSRPNSTISKTTTLTLMCAESKYVDTASSLRRVHPVTTQLFSEAKMPVF